MFYALLFCIWIFIPISVRILHLRLTLPCTASSVPPILNCPSRRHLQVNITATSTNSTWMQDNLYISQSQKKKMQQCLKLFSAVHITILGGGQVANAVWILNKISESNLSRHRILLWFKHANYSTHLWSFICIWINTS